MDEWIKKIKHTGIVFILKKEENPVIYNSMDEPGGHCMLGNKTER